MTKSDESAGEQEHAITITQCEATDRVVVSFPAPIMYVAMSPGQARTFADAVVKCADVVASVIAEKRGQVH